MTGFLPEKLRLPGLVIGGHDGVTCFFVISGFLITLLLLREHEKHGTISLRSFYLRRTLRIVPAYVVYLCAIAALQIAGMITYSGARWAAAVTYTMCFMPHLDYAWCLAHTWSLSVEEQYYLIWPLTFKVLTPRLAIRAVLLYLLATPLIRMGIHHLGPPWMDIDFCSPTQMGSIAARCFLAFLVKGYCLRRASSILVARPGLAVGAALILFACSRAVALTHRFVVPLSDPLNAAAFAMLLFGLLYFNRKSAIPRILNSRLAVFVGILSYSLYLWQQPFVDREVVGDNVWWMLRIIGMFIAAAVSYGLIEQPFLRLKSRFS